MSKTKKLSVIMSVFNENENELTQAINSILEQTFKDFEFIIVLDNPENNTIRELLEVYKKKDNRIKLIVNPQNIGLALSLNTAAKSCCGEYIARMDADDISYVNRFEKELLFLEQHPQCDVVGTRCIKIDEAGNELFTEIMPFTNHNSIAKALKYGNIIVHPSVMMKRELLEKVDYYRDFKNSQDYDLWLRMIKMGAKFHILPEALLKYRVRSNSISGINPARQYSYAAYAQNLSIRETGGENLFSMEDFEHFSTLKRLYKDSDIQRFNDGYRKYCEYGMNKNRVGEIKALLSHRELLRLYLNSKKIDNLKKTLMRRKQDI